MAPERVKQACHFSSPRHSPVVTTVDSLLSILQSCHRALCVHMRAFVPFIYFLPKQAALFPILRQASSLRVDHGFNCLKFQLESHRSPAPQDCALLGLKHFRAASFSSVDRCSKRLTSATVQWVFWFRSRKGDFILSPGVPCAQTPPI